MADETRKLSLGIKDRLTLPAFIPEKSNFVDQILAEDITKKVRINQEEMTEIGLHFTEADKDGRQMLTWNRDKEADKEIELTQAEINFLKKQVDRMDKAEQLSPDLMVIAKAVKGL